MRRAVALSICKQSDIVSALRSESLGWKPGGNKLALHGAQFQRVET